jgi:hypothetical protein
MFHIYSTMENELDATTSPPVQLVWNRFGDQLRRTNALRQDLEEIDSWPVAGPSSETAHYLGTLMDAAQDDNNCAGLFGGQALSAPYRYALELGPGSPKHYDFGAFGNDRHQSIEGIYQALNEAGEMLPSDHAKDAVVIEARTAFAHNVSVYSEDGRLVVDGAIGGMKMVSGFARACLIN